MSSDNTKTLSSSGGFFFSALSSQKTWKFKPNITKNITSHAVRVAILMFGTFKLRALFVLIFESNFDQSQFNKQRIHQPIERIQVYKKKEPNAIWNRYTRQSKAENEEDISNSWLWALLCITMKLVKIWNGRAYKLPGGNIKIKTVPNN